MEIQSTGTNVCTHQETSSILHIPSNHLHCFSAVSVSDTQTDTPKQNLNFAVQHDSTHTNKKGNQVDSSNVVQVLKSLPHQCHSQKLLVVPFIWDTETTGFGNKQRIIDIAVKRSECLAPFQVLDFQDCDFETLFIAESIRDSSGGAPDPKQQPQLEFRRIVNPLALASNTKTHGIQQGLLQEAGSWKYVRYQLFEFVQAHCRWEEWKWQQSYHGEEEEAEETETETETETKTKTEGPCCRGKHNILAVPFLVAHNVGFDKRMLRIEEARLEHDSTWSFIRLTKAESSIECDAKNTTTTTKQISSQDGAATDLLPGPTQDPCWRSSWPLHWRFGCSYRHVVKIAFPVPQGGSWSVSKLGKELGLVGADTPHVAMDDVRILDRILQRAQEVLREQDISLSSVMWKQSTGLYENSWAGMRKDERTLGDHEDVKAKAKMTNTMTRDVVHTNKACPHFWTTKVPAYSDASNRSSSQAKKRKCKRCSHQTIGRSSRQSKSFDEGSFQLVNAGDEKGGDLKSQITLSYYTTDNSHVYHVSDTCGYLWSRDHIKRSVKKTNCIDCARLNTGSEDRRSESSERAVDTWNSRSDKYWNKNSRVYHLSKGCGYFWKQRRGINDDDEYTGDEGHGKSLCLRCAKHVRADKSEEKKKLAGDLLKAEDKSESAMMNCIESRAVSSPTAALASSSSSSSSRSTSKSTCRMEYVYYCLPSQVYHWERHCRGLCRSRSVVESVYVPEELRLCMICFGQFFFCR